jgi:hypothetical protein
VSALAAVLILLLLAGVILIVAAPLRGGDGGSAGRSSADARADGAAAAERRGRHEAATDPAREQLESAREAKYREIRDSELDYRTGKLSHEDYAAIDAQLRGEAIDILNELERLQETGEQELPQPRLDTPDA